MTKSDVYQSVTDRIIAALEAGTVPWRRPWRTRPGAGIPVNARNGRPYRGVNVLLLGLAGYGDPRWGTFKAWKELGASVRKGEKGTRVILWKPVRQNEEAREAGKSDYLLLRDYVVFNAEQVDGAPALPEQPEGKPWEPDERAQAIADGYLGSPWGSAAGAPGYRSGGSAATYSPLLDKVTMPAVDDFDSADGFYATLFHELIHSTGHESRLDRIEPALFGSDPYAREELVAELGASMLAGIAGLATAGGEQNAAYIQSWLRALKNDRKLIVQAAAQAQKAADLILGTTFDAEQVEAAPELAAA